MLSPMSVHRVMGLETEFGISHPGHPNANPVRMSGLVVNAHALAAGRPNPLARRWDYQCVGSGKYRTGDSIGDLG